MDNIPTIVLEGSLSPSTISLSSPDLALKTITLNLKVRLRNCSGPITVLTSSPFLSSREQDHYSSNYCLLDTETNSVCSASVTTSCFPTEHIIIKNPQEDLLELGTLDSSENSTAVTLSNPANQDPPKQQPLTIKVDIGIHKSSPATQETPSDLSICATPLHSLVQGRKYQVNLCAPGRGPVYLWWWSPEAKTTLIANPVRERGSTTGLIGPVTLPGTERPVYAVRRGGNGHSGPVVRVEMGEGPVLNVVA